VTLREYGDFECEHCAETFRVVKEIRRWLRGELCYVFRHFPAANKHTNAFPAAEAAEAAGAQGREDECLSFSEASSKSSPQFL
jgi:protein-disulfide isomerase